MANKRLGSVATELNVSLQKIVDHLSSKGFEQLDPKPNTSISDAMYSELTSAFQESMKVKSQADQLNIGHRAAPPKGTAPATPVGTSTTTEKKSVAGGMFSSLFGRKPTEPAVETPQPTATVVEPAPKPAEPEPVQAPKPVVEAPAPVVEAKVAPQTPPAEPKEQTNQAPPAPTPTAPVREGLKVLYTVDLDANKPKPKQKDAPKPQNRDTQRHEQNQQNQQRQQQKPAAAAPPVAKPAVVPPVVAPAPEPVVKAPVDPDEGLVRSKTPELRGLKILGKVDTEKFKENARGSGSLSEAEKRKRKRKKIVGPQGNNTGGTGNPGGQGQGGQGQGQGGNRPGGQGQGQGQGGNRPGGQGQGQGQGGNRPGGQGQGQGQGQGGNRPGGPSQGGFNRPSGPGGNRPNTSGPGQGARRPDFNNGQPREISQKDIDDKIKATMAAISGGRSKGRQKVRRDKRDLHRERAEKQQAAEDSGSLQLTEFVTVSELASLMDVTVAQVITTCMSLGVIASLNQRLDAEIIELVASEFGFAVEFLSAEGETDLVEDVVDAPEDLKTRAPIVTVMGHVDHGKTSLLDYIRKAKVAAGEAGGITQHVGAYEVVTAEGKKVTFLDTPGHEAFTAMRARGAKVTDIAVIIVAADDNVMPQTKEAISHAQAANVPIVIAINKMDKDGADPERIKNELSQMNILVEDWGGKYQSQEISAKKGTGIDQLLEKILFEAELLDLKANPDRDAIGSIIEASLDKGRGYISKVLIQHGTLKDGDIVVSGEYSGRVKAMFNEHGTRIKTAGPSTPVMVLGLTGAPAAGEKFRVMQSEQEARQIASKRMQISREQANRASKRISLDEIGRRLALGTFKELNLIVKGDVDGSVEALADSLLKLSLETVQVRVIHKAVGQIIESDVLLASASDAIIIGFQVRPSLGARKLSEQEGVQIKTYSIIYEAIEEIKAAIVGMLEPTKEENITGSVEVRDVFKISKIGTVAGCYVTEGKITRNSYIRVIRDGIVVFPTREGANGEISSLKRFKDDQKEVRAGFECGLTIKNYNDIAVGDTIETYEIVEVRRTS